MKTLQEIKTEWAKDHSYENYFEFLDLTRKCDTDHVFIMDGAVTQIAKRFAKEVAKEALKNASENVVMKVHDGHFKTNSPSTHIQIGANNIQIDKQSILRKENIPEL